MPLLRKVRKLLKPQAYTSKRRILIEVLPVPNAYTKSGDAYIHFAKLPPFRSRWADLVYSLGTGSTWMNIRLLEVLACDLWITCELLDPLHWKHRSTHILVKWGWLVIPALMGHQGFLNTIQVYQWQTLVVPLSMTNIRPMLWSNLLQKVQSQSTVLWSNWDQEFLVKFLSVRHCSPQKCPTLTKTLLPIPKIHWRH